MKFGGREDIPNVEVMVPCNVFENAIREYGVVAACEWFGHAEDSDFTKATISILLEKSGVAEI